MSRPETSLISVWMALRTRSPQSHSCSLGSRAVTISSWISSVDLKEGWSIGAFSTAWDSTPLK